MLRHWGVIKLGAYEYSELLDEMKHADKLIERIPFLDGLPNLQDLDKLLICDSVREILDCDLQLEQNAMPVLREGIAYCESVRDLSPATGSAKSSRPRRITSTLSRASSS